MASAGDASSPTGLLTEYATDPLGIDEPEPRLSWIPVQAQTSYQVRIGTAAACSDVWNPGRVASGRPHEIAAAGLPLRSGERYFWSVRTWDREDVGSRWSESATFEMGLLSEQDWQGAQWITRDGGDEAGSLLCKEFRLPGRPIERARLYLSALGYGVAHLDGRRIGTDVLHPAPTNYARTVLYSTYDVTDALSPGKHMLGVELGRGRYAEPADSVWFWNKAPWWDRPKLLALLTIWLTGGGRVHIVSDPSWRALDGPTRFDSLYLGERYDARYERARWTTPGATSSWPRAVPAVRPSGVLRAHGIEPIREVATCPPAGMTVPVAGVRVYDFGRQLAGYARMTVRGNTGSRVELRYGERLDTDGLVVVPQEHIRGDIQTDSYVLRGDGPETFVPSFSYKGFQYVQVTGLAPDDLQAIEAHTDVASVGSFSCDDDIVNRIHVGTRRALLSNLHGIPTDTPTYEKNGWTADAHLTANAAAFNFFMPRVYTKWLRDFADAQLPSGELPPIVPTSGWGYRGSDASITAPVPAWDAAYVEIPWVMYRHYGDSRILARYYDGQRRYLGFLLDCGLDGGVVSGGLGDFLAPGTTGVPREGPSVYETAYAYRIVTLLQRIAAVLGRDQDIDEYADVGALVHKGFNAAFLDRASAVYHGENPTEYRQSPNVLALQFGLVPAALRTQVLERLVADIRARDNHLNTGVLGTRYLFPLLTEHGLVDLAFEIATQRTYPGYGYWLEHGATALLEAWEAEARSRNHHFYGSVDQWFYEHIAGISPSAPGFASVRIRPRPPSALAWARAEVSTVHGRVATGWRRVRDGIELTVEIPPGARAEVHVPGGDVEQCGGGRWQFHGQ